MLSSSSLYKEQIAFIGDARWAEGYGKPPIILPPLLFTTINGGGRKRDDDGVKPFYDLIGFTRLSSGLNVALQDGVQLGELLVDLFFPSYKKLSSSVVVSDIIQDKKQHQDKKGLGKFDAKDISNDIFWCRRVRYMIQFSIICLVSYILQLEM